MINPVSCHVPGWCPCIDCAASATSSSTVTVNNNGPDEVTQVKNAETVYSEPLTRRPLSLNRRRKRVPSEECSESPVVATGCKKPQKSTVAVSEERFSFNTDEHELEAFKKGECPANTTKSTEWAMKNFELWRIARNAKFGDPQCIINAQNAAWFEDKENLCGWLCRFVTETRKADVGKYTPFQTLL